MKIVIRADASIKMGSGHVMRCLTLAESLREKGASIMFISRKHEGNLNQLIIEKGFQVKELKQPESINDKIHKNEDIYKDWLGVSVEKDAEDTINVIGNKKPDLLIIDHYSLGEKWEKELKSYVKSIFVIDDIANRKHDCDILLDQNLFENMDTRYDGLVSANCTQLLGPEYALLRPEFAEARKNLKPRKNQIQRVFVFFGGSDPHNLTGMTLRALSEPELTNLKVDVVIGENNPHHHDLKKLITSRASTYLHVQVDDIASIMTNADLAIGSGGVNTWERMCLGLPALVISFSENQNVLVGDLVKYCYTNFLGSFTDVDEFIIKKSVLDIIGKPRLIKDQSIKISKLVDGHGTQLFADWLIGDLSNQHWKVKNATTEDMELYWIWANDKQVRNNALNKDLISWKNHLKWFKTKLANKNSLLYLILADKKPVGQVRFDIERNYARIDYSIARQFRGRKLGKQILRLAIHEFQKNNRIKILAEVLPNNIASAKTFESLGFTMEISQENIIYVKEAKELTKINA